MLALKIILGIIAFFVLILSVRVTLYMTYDEEFKLDIGWLFIKLHILPKKEKTEKEKKPKKEPKEEQEKQPAEEVKSEEKKDNIIVSFYKNQGFSGVLQLLKDTVNAINGMFGTIFRHFVFRELKLYMTVGSSDAAQTAQLYGKTCAAVFPAMGLITSTCNVKEYDCAVKPNFMVAEKSAIFRVVLSFRPIFAIAAVVVLAFKLLFKVVFKLLKNKSKESVNQTTKTQNTNNIKEDKKI